jgi:hypothetical protein
VPPFRVPCLPTKKLVLCLVFTFFQGASVGYLFKIVDSIKIKRKLLCGLNFMRVQNNQKEKNLFFILTR